MWGIRLDVKVHEAPNIHKLVSAMHIPRGLHSPRGNTRHVRVREDGVSKEGQLTPLYSFGASVCALTTCVCIACAIMVCAASYCECVPRVSTSLKAVGCERCGGSNDAYPRARLHVIARALGQHTLQARPGANQGP